MTVSLDLFSGRIRGGQGKGGGAPEREFPFEAILFLPAVGKSLALTAANVIPNLQTFCLPLLVRPDLVSSSYMLSSALLLTRGRSQPVAAASDFPRATPLAHGSRQSKGLDYQRVLVVGGRHPSCSSVRGIKGSVENTSAFHYLRRLARHPLQTGRHLEYCGCRRHFTRYWTQIHCTYRNGYPAGQTDFPLGHLPLGAIRSEPDEDPAPTEHRSVLSTD